MYSRKEYLAGGCTHSEYYQQFVTDSVIELVKGIDASAPLREWDKLASFVRVGERLRAAGDVDTLAGRVCILKEAKRIRE